MAYLSRIRINPQRAQSRKLLGDRQAMHAAVLGGLPDGTLAGRSLWRVDSDDPLRPSLLVLTPARPSWEHLVEQVGWPGSEGPHADVAAYSGLLERIAVGDEYRFRVTANPTRSLPSTPAETTRARGTRVGHITVRHQLDWFMKRTAAWGFSVATSSSDDIDPNTGDLALELRVSGRQRAQFRRGSAQGAGSRVTLEIATFEGRLTVVDANALRVALVSGLGPAKAYGCGLLTLALPGQAPVAER